LASLDDVDPDVDALRDQEIDRRSADLASGHVVGIPVADVLAEGERRLRR